MNSYLKKFKQKSKIHSETQALAEQIWLYFNKKIPFSRIMKMIQTKGRQFVYECWNETRQSDATDHLALFLWKVAQTKIAWTPQNLQEHPPQADNQSR